MAFIKALLPVTNILSIDDSTTKAITDIADNVAKNGADPVLIALVAVLIVVVVFAIVTILMKNNGRNNKNMDSNNEFMQKMLESERQNNEAQMKTMLKMVQDMVRPINDKVDGLTEHNRKKDEENEYHKDIVGNFVHMNQNFRSVSMSALESLKADRIGIYVFHNGNSSIHGLPFFKMSCIGDCDPSGKVTMRGTYQIDAPLQVFGDFIENLYKYGYFKAGDVAKAAERDPSLLEFTAFAHTKAMYILAVRDRNDALAGFVIAEFNELKNFDDPAYDKEVRSILEHMANTILPIVTDFKNKKRLGNNEE